jgi:hypothetical protein
MSREVTSCGRDRPKLLFRGENDHDRVVQADSYLTCDVFGYPGVVLPEVHISAILQAILDVPIEAKVVEQLNGRHKPIDSGLGIC